MPPEYQHRSSRSLRRAMEKTLRKSDVDYQSLETVRPTELNTLLDFENDLSLYQRELKLARKLETHSRLMLESLGLYMKAGVSEETYRQHLIVSIPGQQLYDRYAVEVRLVSEADPARIVQIIHRVKAIDAENRRLNIKTPYTREAVDEAILLLTDPNIPLEDLLKDNLRVRHESSELLRMHVQWLENEEREERRLRQLNRKAEQAIIQQSRKPIKEENPLVINAIEEVAEEPVKLIEEIALVTPESKPFNLKGWELFWTSSHWSRNPHHFISIPTDSRERSVDVFKEIARGEIMIDPSSVIRALEFHLSKDIIQRALATRLHYGPEDRRDWIKIKRGRGRILLLIPEKEKERAIFFAGNRDDIYD